MEKIPFTQKIRQRLKSPIATGHSVAVRWAFACLCAVCCGAVLAYCWRVFYYLDARAPLDAAWEPLRVTLLCMLGGGLAVGAAALVRFAAKSFTARAALCLWLCGLLFVFANPPMQTPDESQHFLRCEAISLGRFDFDAARGYPADVSALYSAFPGAWVNAHTSQGLETDADTGEEKAYTSAGYALKQYGEDGYPESVADSYLLYRETYSLGGDASVTEPLSLLILPFLPQALGMAAARLLGFLALGQLYAGRMANLLCYVLLCALALKQAEKYRPALLAVMLLPLSLYMAGSLSYDGTLLGCYYLMAALLTRREWTTKTVSIYLAACVFANMTKPYINLLWILLPLLLPKARFAAKGKRWQWLAAMLTATLAGSAFVEWYGSTFRYNYGVIARMGGGDVNQLEQLRFVLGNPLRFVAVLAGTLYENDFFIGQLGLFGWKDLPISFLSLTGPVALVLGAVLAAAVPARENPLAGRRTRVGLGAFALLYGVGAMAAMYITYTPVSMVRIVGLQARYFLPVWLVCLFLLAGALRRLLRPQLAAARAESLALWWFAPYAALGALLLFQHYYVGPIFTIG